MSGDNPLSIDRLEEFVSRLDAYMSDVVYVEPNSEVERILSLTGFELKSLTSEECCEKAYAIYNYCNFLQKKHNKEVAKAKWCEEFINYAVSKVSNQFMNMYTSVALLEATFLSNLLFSEVPSSCRVIYVRNLRKCLLVFYSSFDNVKIS